MRFAQEISIFNPHAIEMAVVALGTRITQTAEEIRLEAAQTLTNYSTTVQMNAAISTKANEITSEVSQTYATQQSVNNSVSSLSTRITQNATSISSEVTARQNGDNTLSTRINQSAHTISMSVSGKAGKTTGAGITITLKDANGRNISSGSGNILIDGEVVFASQLTDGVTRISGNNIITGTISANRIAANSIAVSKLTGSISKSDVAGGTAWKIDFDNGTMTIGSINADHIQAGTISANRIGANSVGVSKLSGSIGSGDWKIDFTNGTFTIGTISADSITTGTMSGDRISAGTITGTTISGGTLIATGNSNGDIVIGGGTINVPWIQFADGNHIAGSWTIDGSTAYDNWDNKRLINGYGIRVGDGSSAHAWSWFQTGVYFEYNTKFDMTPDWSSDIRKKNFIAYADEDESVRFIMGLRPCKFAYKTDEAQETHHGFIAQEARNAVQDDWCLVSEDAEGYLGIKYIELIADLVATAQAQDKRIKALEAQHE